VLQHAADLLRQQCGASDLAARIGGEEFALLLPDVTLEGAAARCEVLRHRFESYDWRAVHPHLHVTLSIGIAQWEGHLGPAALLQSADSRLYQAKNAGRNQVA
jgi:diguanylate cyclase (GGDEF)-like protein